MDSVYDQSWVNICQVSFYCHEPPHIPLQDAQQVAILGVLSRAGFRLHPPTSFGNPDIGKLVYLCEHKDKGIGREYLETALRTAKEQAPRTIYHSTVSVTYTLG